MFAPLDPGAHPPSLCSVEICAGGGGQALGLELAGFAHAAVVELDPAACATLRANRPAWTVHEGDVRGFSGLPYRGVDLLAGGVPCPPFSVAGKQLGPDDERDLFPEALRLVEEIRPRAVLLENVRGLSSPKFADYRKGIEARLRALGFVSAWRLLHASDHGVPQLRPRYLLVALREEYAGAFCWPEPRPGAPSVGESLHDLMGARGWPGAARWAEQARGVAPTIVGGSKKHGGPDLGPTRARRQWAALGVNGLGVAAEPPPADAPEDHVPKLTVQMVARLQGFPDTWRFVGTRTSAYRQVGNAFPPPVARAVGGAIRSALATGRVIPAPPPESALQGLPILDLLSRQSSRARGAA